MTLSSLSRLLAWVVVRSGVWSTFSSRQSFRLRDSFCSADNSHTVAQNPGQWVAPLNCWQAARWLTAFLYGNLVDDISIFTEVDAMGVCKMARFNVMSRCGRGDR